MAEGKGEEPAGGGVNAVILALSLQAAAASTAPAAAPAPMNTAPNQIAAAAKLVDLLRIEATLDTVFVQLSPGFAPSVIGVLATDARTKGTIEKLIDAAPENRDRMLAILSAEFLASVKRRFPEFKREIAKEYATAFTMAELEAITAFYSSGPGAKALAIMPQMQAKLATAGQAIGRVAGEEAGSRAFKKIEEEMLPDAKKPAA
jgi:hypothetical protein